MEAEPIINPFEDNPQEHLFLRNYRFKYRTEIGQRTIRVTALNDREYFVNVRAKIGTAVLDQLEDIWDAINEDQQGFFNVRGRSARLIRKFKNLLKEGNRTKEYAATVATVLLEDEAYQRTCQFFNQHGLWDEELQNLHQELEFCALRPT